jgi:hypothetical protein
MIRNQPFKLFLQSSLLISTLFTASGCNSFAGTSNQTQNAINNNSATNICPKQPVGVLDKSNVKSIRLAANEVNESGQIHFGQSLGFEFEAKAKQKLELSTQENLCLYIYTPSNQMLSDNILPENGKYIVQVAIPSGMATFSLAMKLASTDISVNSPPKEIISPVGQHPTTQIQVPPSTSFENFRVSFDTGSVGTSIRGNISPSHTNRYLLDCGSGQSMSIRVGEGNINLNVIDPEGRNIGRINNGFWRGKLPMSGDYALEISASNGSSYKINIEVI